MTISYQLAPIPKWYIADLTGKPLGAGSMQTYSSLDHQLPKLVYQDAEGNIPWPTTILFDENGSQGPFYWEVDNEDPTNQYYIEVYDAEGIEQFTVDDYGPVNMGGGNIPTSTGPLVNLITNNVFYQNIGTSQTPLPTYLKIAASNHQGFAETPSNAGPDIIFIKNNTNANDQLSYIPFTLGDTPLTGDVTPSGYLKYTCSNNPTAETLKVIQFPITQNVQNLSGSDITITLWARSNSLASSLQIYSRQFFGDGSGASPDERELLSTLSLSDEFEKFTLNATIPSVSGKVIGGCGNDALFIQIQYPLNTFCDIDITKACLFIGTATETGSNYLTYDLTSSIVNSPRTGDLRFTFNNHGPFGWIYMNDQTIGSAASGATNRANVDVFPVYNLLWNSVIDQWAPVVGGRGASAIADFTANKPIYLTKALGRVFAGTLNTYTNLPYTADFTTDILTISDTTNYPTGAPVDLSTTGAPPTGLSLGVTYYAINLSPTTLQLALSPENAVAGSFINFSDNGSGVNDIRVTPYDLGEYAGAESVSLTGAQNGPHTHNTVGGGSTGAFTYPLFDSPASDLTASTTSSGTGAPHNNLPPTTYCNVFIKM